MTTIRDANTVYLDPNGCPNGHDPCLRRLVDGECVRCKAARHAAYRAVHKDEIATESAAYYTAHKDEIRAHHSAYYAAHKAEIAARHAAYAAAHKDEARAYHLAYSAAHKAEIAARSAAHRAAHKAEIAARGSAYRATHKAQVAARSAAYRSMHKAQIAARSAAQYKTHKAGIAARHQTPGGRARDFLRNHQDCTSTLAEVEAAYASGRHVVTGQSGKIGRSTNDLVMGHVHGGPIVGLIWVWENHLLTETVLAFLAEFKATLALHLEVARRSGAATE